MKYKMVVEDNDEILGKYKKMVDISKDGLFVDIEIQNPDIQIAVEDGLFELYAYHENRKSISLEINKIIFVFNRVESPEVNIYKVIGRKYMAGSDVFLMPPVFLGEISLEKWIFIPDFFNKMYPLIEVWMNTMLSHK